MQDPLISQNEGFSSFENEVKDEKLLFFLLGNASLLAFNIIINAVDIFASISGRNVGVVSANLNRCYNIPCSIMALLLCFIKPKNLKVTLISALLVDTIIMVIFPIFMLVKMSQNATYYGSLVCAGIVGVASSILFSSSFSFAAQYKDGSVPYVSSGNGACGVLAAVMRLITKAIKDTAALNSVYFFLAAAIFIVTLIYFAAKARHQALATRLTLVQDGSEKKSNNTFAIFKIIIVQWLSVFFNFCITLSLFPGYMVNAKAGKIGSWSPIIITTVFCIFDWVGRAIPSYCNPIVSIKFSCVPIICRALFYLIFILSIKSVIKGVDPWWTYSWDVVFALSNGYFGTVCMIYGNGHPDLKEIDDKRTAGFLMPFAVNAGILAAMGVSYIMDLLK